MAKDLGPSIYYLDMEIQKDHKKKTVLILEKVLARFGRTKCAPTIITIGIQLYENQVKPEAIREYRTYK